MPWGSCMLSMECEPEFRIYRGDFFCGQTEFVCCAIQLTGYDMYQGFDLSLNEESMSTDSAEKQKHSKEERRKKKRRDRRNRKKLKMRRKKRIKRNIKKIVKEIRKLLMRNFRNGTALKRKRALLLKKFVKKLKKQYKQDRFNLKELHEETILKIDADLQRKLNKIRNVNTAFMENATFRDMLVKGLPKEKLLRMYAQAHPQVRSLTKTRRTVMDESSYVEDESYLEDDQQDDVEYGYLYY